MEFSKIQGWLGWRALYRNCPYYTILKAEILGYFLAVNGAGRRINDNLGIFIASKVIMLMIKMGIKVNGVKVLILGFTFIANCTNIRNTSVKDVYNELLQFETNVVIYYAWPDKKEVIQEYGVELKDQLNSKYDCILLSVAHDEFILLNYYLYKGESAVIYDEKSFLNKKIVDVRL